MTVFNFVKRSKDDNLEVIDQMIESSSHSRYDPSVESIYRLLNEPDFFKKIERKMNHIVPLSKRASFCYLFKKFCKITYERSKENKKVKDKFT